MTLSERMKKEGVEVKPTVKKQFEIVDPTIKINPIKDVVMEVLEGDLSLHRFREENKEVTTHATGAVVEGITEFFKIRKDFTALVQPEG